MKPSRDALFNPRTHQRKKPVYLHGEDELLYRPWILKFALEGSLDRLRPQQLARLERQPIHRSFSGMDPVLRERAMGRSI